MTRTPNALLLSLEEHFLFPYPPHWPGSFLRHLTVRMWLLIAIYATSGSVQPRGGITLAGLPGGPSPAFSSRQKRSPTPLNSQEETGHRPRVQHFITVTEHRRDHLGLREMLVFPLLPGSRRETSPPARPNGGGGHNVKVKNKYCLDCPNSLAVWP